jgi:hypothetical protein
VEEKAAPKKGDKLGKGKTEEKLVEPPKEVEDPNKKPDPNIRKFTPHCVRINSWSVTSPYKLQQFLMYVMSLPQE